MNTVMRTILAILCVFLVMVCAVLIVQKVSGRAGVDLTEQKLYTLSDGTKNILGKLTQPVTLKLYYSRTAALKGSEEIRYYNNYFLYVRDLLNEYTRLSNGMLRFTIIDPRKYTDEEEDAIDFGVKRWPLSKDENFYFGLVASTDLGKSGVISFFEPDRQEFVEYDISRLISTVTQREKKQIGILSSMPVTGDEMTPYMMEMLQIQGREPEAAWYIVPKLRKDYEVTRVDPATDFICDHIDYLMVVHPKELSQETLYAIDQFVMHGGKLIVFVDPCCMKDLPPKTSNNPWDASSTYAMMNYRSSSDLNALLRGWGVEMQPELIAVDRTLAGMAGNPPQEFQILLELTEECVNPDEVVVAKLHSLSMAYAGSLVEVPGAGATVTPLITTTSVGNTWKPASLFELKMPRPDKIAEAAPDGDKPVTLACRISGKLKSNFPDGLKKDSEGESAESSEKSDIAEPEHSHAHETDEDNPHQGHHHSYEKDTPPLKETEEEATVLVFADVDMLTDNYAYKKVGYGSQQIGDNANLVFNGIEYLGGSNDLIAIRSRGQYNRPFTRVDQIETELEKSSREKVEEINLKIKEYNDELRKLERPGDEKDAKLLESQILVERDKIRAERRACEKELRKLNAEKRAKLEHLKLKMGGIAVVLAPLGVLLIAIVLALVRFIKAKLYAARRPGK